jgi:tetratricopeptide (TPR) repeat protein
MFRRILAAALLPVAIACSSRPAPVDAPEPAPAPAPLPVTTASGAPQAPASDASAPAPKLVFSQNDVAQAMQRAKREGKAVFVDAWAPWCHTCLSMKHYVFVDPSLAPLSERMAFVAIDTDRPENVAFVEKYAIDVWPTFFVLDPEGGDVIGFWPGAASVREIRELATGALDVLDARRSAGKAADPVLAALVKARALHAERNYDQAARAYAAALKIAPPDWARRSEALFGWVGSLAKAGRGRECVEAGMKHLRDVRGAALPADFARVVFQCTDGIADAKKRRAAREAAVARLRELVASPPAEASIDDRADALDILAGSLETLNDRAGAKQAHEQQVALLERAASEAATPQAASTYDYQRAMAYLALGRPEAAVKMLQEREKQLPDSYEPPARLASVLAEMGRTKDALAAIDRALPHSYGPRKLRYLALKARIQTALGDRAGTIATLEQELAGWKELGTRAPADRLRDTQRRLDAARRAPAR